MAGILDEVKQLVDGALASSNVAVKGIENTATITERVFIDEATKIGAGASSAVQEVNRTGAQAMAQNELFSHTLNALNILFVAVELRRAVDSALKRLPPVLAKRAVRAFELSTTLFSPLITSLDNHLHEQASRVIHNHIRVVEYGVTMSGVLDKYLKGTFLDQTPKPAPYQFDAKAPPAYATEHELQALRHQVQKLNYALGVEQHSAHIPPQIWQQIHTLQREQAATTRAIAHLNDRLNAEAAKTQSAINQLQAVLDQLHGLRAVSAGWQDVQREIERAITTLTTQYNGVAARQHTQGRTLTSLLPLALLLQPGIQGLRTLRQLEDTPCMCPKFGNIPNELGTALAVMEFVENG